jgi:hypothetical protein
VNAAIESLDQKEDSASALRDGRRRDSWAEALAGVGPFLALGPALVLMESGWALAQRAPGSALSMWVPLASFGAAYLFLVAGFGVGWVKGFPRWSYPYVTLVLELTLYWMGVATPGLRLLGHTFGRSELWGLRAWIPFLVMAAVALLLTRSVWPWLRVVVGVCRDWTRLTFGLYGGLLLAVWLSFDEVDFSYEFPYLVIAIIALTVGALAYGRSAGTWGRAVALLAGASVALALTNAGVVSYWNGPGDGWVDVGAMFVQQAGVMAFLFSPALLSLLLRLARCDALPKWIAPDIHREPDT